ncbi:MAG: methionine--tRNA ligase [Candidatus Azosocius agrarius]|nr:MAG: methionine--tRNA ligase [Gammaproteobacteria bacterium]
MYYKKREILITSALPYANGPLHIGNILEHIQCDIWSRFHNLNGSLCIKVCGDDSHGTPIMLHANKIGVSPKNLIKKIYKEHLLDLAKFDIYYDNYYRTHSIENKVFICKVFKKLFRNNLIKKNVINQLFDTIENIFLPDRYIIGTCPKCFSENQYSDNCSICGACYDSLNVINPISVLSKEVPIKKKTIHYFFCLDKFYKILKFWHECKLHESVINKLKEWFIVGLKKWDISRDSPYFGFKIPNEDSKYFYVWMDAPIGYISIFNNLCMKNSNFIFSKYWKIKTNIELYHFIGKDIMYFHTLFWPSILHGINFKMPNNIFIHGFLIINNKKMSKSKGTFLTAAKFSKYLNSEYLRYYYASKLNNVLDDIDLNINDFVNKVNSDIIGKFVNILSRIIKFINTYFDNKLSKNILNFNKKIIVDFINQKYIINEYYENRQYCFVLKHIMFLCDKINFYINNQKPWILIKDNENFAFVQEICTTVINIFKILTFYIKPILPKISNNIELILNIYPLNYKNYAFLLLDHKINPYVHLVERLDENMIKNIMNI